MKHHKTKDIEARFTPNYSKELWGYGVRTLTRPRGFKGSKYGAASKGKRLLPEEIQLIEADLKKKGRI